MSGVKIDVNIQKACHDFHAFYVNKAMKKITLSILVLISSLAFLKAEVIPVTLVTGRGEGSPDGVPSSYTVPAGKVLIVESVQYQNSGGSLGIPDQLSVKFRETFDNASLSRSVFIDLGANRSFQQHYFDTPIRLKAGSALQSNRIQGFYIWRGLLADRDDLFAKLDVQLDETKVEGSRLMANAKVSSPRPYRLKVESSSDLKTFAKDESAIVTSSPNPKLARVSVATEEKDEKYLRVVAQVRR